jgi:hypothetical protein
MHISAKTARAVVAALTLSFAMAVSAQAAPPSGPPEQNVTVVNTTANPVPVTGNVGVTGSVSVVNTPNVNIANLPAVSIEPGRFPYQQFTGFNQGPTNCPNEFYCVVTFPPVPQGKRLVVTYVSAQFTLTGEATEASAAVGMNADIFHTLDVPATLISAKFNRYLASSAIMFFVDAGQSPSVFIAGQSVTPTSSSVAISLVGYLVPLP